MGDLKCVRCREHNLTCNSRNHLHYSCRNCRASHTKCVYVDAKEESVSSAGPTGGKPETTNVDCEEGIVPEDFKFDFDFRRLHVGYTGKNAHEIWYEALSLESSSYHLGKAGPTVSSKMIVKYVPQVQAWLDANLKTFDHSSDKAILAKRIFNIYKACQATRPLVTQHIKLEVCDSQRIVKDINGNPKSIQQSIMLAIECLPSKPVRKPSALKRQASNGLSDLAVDSPSRHKKNKVEKEEPTDTLEHYNAEDDVWQGMNSLGNLVDTITKSGQRQRKSFEQERARLNAQLQEHEKTVEKLKAKLHTREAEMDALLNNPNSKASGSGRVARSDSKLQQTQKTHTERFFGIASSIAQDLVSVIQDNPDNWAKEIGNTLVHTVQSFKDAKENEYATRLEQVIENAVKSRRPRCDREDC